MEQYGLIKRAD